MNFAVIVEKKLFLSCKKIKDKTMFYIKSTKNAIGFQLWGSREDLSELYDSFSIFFNDQIYDSELEFDSCDKIISGVLYEIRKAFNDSVDSGESDHVIPVESDRLKSSPKHVLYFS
ncbi:DUF6904 family protein [Myroides odoratimimus]|uniref:DUF6904 family protein n=1 Tax=Myroides odoratimimus TaxID=76832 RepID=UPI002578BCA5|nr:hypothetical protein [Myroides odoratimimus]